MESSFAKWIVLQAAIPYFCKGVYVGSDGPKSSNRVRTATNGRLRQSYREAV